MSAATHLHSLSSSLVLSEGEKSSINTSVSTLHSRLASYFGDSVTEDFKFGSYTRGTILPRKADSQSDVDYMVVFNDGSSYKPQTLLSRLKAFAEKKYSTSEIRQSSPTMVLELSHIRFELVPAYKPWLGGGYYIPSPSSNFSDWTHTTPNDFNTSLSTANQSANNYLKPAIRLLKYWNGLRDYPFASFSLEKWCAEQWLFDKSSVKAIFFTLGLALKSEWDMSQKAKASVDSLHKAIDAIRDDDANGYTHSAEMKAKKLLPEIK